MISIPVRKSSQVHLRMRSLKTKLSIGAVHLLLILFVFIALAPVVLIIMNSFKNQLGIFANPFNLPTAATFDLGGYIRAFTLGNFGTYYLNSLIVTVTSTFLTVAFSALAAFGIAEYRVRAASPLSGFFIIGIMLPVQLGTVSLLRMMVSWHLMDTLTSLILVYTGMSLPIGVILMVTYFRSVPSELKDAGRVDGAGEWRTMLLVLPIVRPGLAAVTAITMLPIWNNLWFPLILASGKNSQTVTLGVQQFVGQHQNDWPALLASLVLSAVPLVILFVIFSKQFMAGLTEGSGK
jgi:raffinose/stachyose/melibiose transport system permease protein